jgi:hypothetical protein
VLDRAEDRASRGNQNDRHLNNSGKPHEGASKHPQDTETMLSEVIRKDRGSPA